MYMKRLTIALLLTLTTILTAYAQTPLKRVYDDNLNSIEQIDAALAEAKGTGRFVLSQVGGNWCPWCLRFADFATRDTTIAQVIADNYVYIHVNYPGRTAKLEPAKADMVNATMARLGNPGRFGYPVFVVLDDSGRILHTQDSSFLEEGNGYSREKTLRFLNAWTPKAVNAAK